MISRLINTNHIYIVFQDQIHVFKFIEKIDLDKSGEDNLKDSELFVDDSLKFSNDNISKYFEEVSSELTEVELFKLLEKENVKYNKNTIPKRVSITLHKLKNLVLFQNTSIHNLLQIISNVLLCSTLSLKFDYCEPVNNQTFVVGNNPIIIISQSELTKTSNITSINFINWYDKMINYCKTYKNFDYNLDHFVIGMSLYLYPKKEIDTDIISMFNKSTTISSWWSKKITIHDSVIDLIKNSPKRLYIKESNKLNIPTTHIATQQNTLTFEFKIRLLNQEINLNYVSFKKNGVIILDFTFNTCIDYKTIPNILTEFIMTKADVYFPGRGKDLLLIDFLMELSLFKNYSNTLDYKPIDISDFNVEVGNITSIYSFKFPDNKPININEISKLQIFEEITSRFSSKTSVCLSYYPFYCNLNYKKFKKENKSKKTKIDPLILPELKFDKTDNELNIYATSFANFEELNFALDFSLPIYEIQTKEDKIPTEPHELILHRLRQISVKQNLKILINNDSILFGPRIVSGGTMKAYSALVQKKNQRPSIISKKEYEIMKEYKPESVIDVKNLTNQKERLYLICPYEDSSYINFHEFKEQKCIIRCTSKPSNTAQIQLCATDLGASDDFIRNIPNNGTSHACIKYTTTLVKGRKCFLPGAMEYVFPQLCCIRVTDLTKNITTLNEYLEYKYGGTGLTIRPRVLDGEFSILTPVDITGKTKYYLIIQPTNSETLKYVVINNLTEELFCVNDSPEFFKLIVNRYRGNSKHNVIIKYMRKYITHDINNLYNEDDPFISVIETISKNGYKTIIQSYNSQLVGLLKISTNTLFLIPSIYWYYKNSTISTDSQRVLLEYLSGNINLVDFSYLYNINKTGEIVYDTNNMIVGLKTENNIIQPCKPISPMDANINESRTFRNTFDINGYLLKILNVNNPMELMFEDNYQEGYKLIEFSYYMLKKFIKIYPEWYLDKDPVQLYLNMIEKITGGFSNTEEHEFKASTIFGVGLGLSKTKLNLKKYLKFITNNHYFKFTDKHSIESFLVNELIKTTNLHYLPIETLKSKDFI